MFKTLVATCLLTFSCSSGGLKVNERIKKEVNQPDSYAVRGAYNFVDTFDFEDIESGLYSITFCDDVVDSKNYNCPTVLPTTQSGQYVFLYRINFDVSYYNVELDFYFYNYNYVDSEPVTYNLSHGYGSNDLIFYLNDTVYIHGDFIDVWNSIFTHDDNENTVTYTGWYTLNNNLSQWSNFFIAYGNIQFDNKLMWYVTDNYQGVIGGNRNSFIGSYFSVENNAYDFFVYGLPLDYKEVSSNAMYFNSVKMTRTDYTILAQNGVFGYVPHVETSDFYDLMYSVMDSPLYMVSKLLNWELLGVNVFIALTGLLTAIVILTLIRKFW